MAQDMGSKHSRDGEAFASGDNKRVKPSRQGRHSVGAVRPTESAQTKEPTLGQVPQATEPVSTEPQAMRPVEYSSKAKKPKKKHRALKAFLVILVLLAAVGGAGYHFGKQLYDSAMRVADDGRAIMSEISLLEPAIKGGDTETLRTTLQDMEAKVANMKEETSTPLWNNAAKLPYIGQDIQNAQALVGVLDDVSTNALAPIEQNAEVLQLSGLVEDGRVNTGALQQLADLATGALPVVSRAEETLANLEPGRIEQVNEIIEKAQSGLAGVAPKIDKYAPLLPVLPAMLGGDGPRTYLIVAQNNAEAKPSGGYMGAVGEIYVEDGEFTLQNFEGIKDVELDEEPSEIWDDEYVLFGEDYGRVPRELSKNPDFARTGYLLTQQWSAYTGTAYDGVIAIDPVFLQKMLSLTGPIELPDGTVVDGTNAARIVLHDVYWSITDHDAQDVFFGVVAEAAFRSFTSNISSVNLSEFTKVLGQSATSYRILAYMVREDEEAAMESMLMAGALSLDPEEPELGVHLIDNTWSKIDWYLDAHTTVQKLGENADGSTTYLATTTLTNTITEEEAAEADVYVTGYNWDKASPSDMLTGVWLFAPAGGSISAPMIDGTGGYSYYTVYGLDVFVCNTHAEAGETVTLKYEVTTAPGAGDLKVRMTPLARDVSQVTME